MTAAVHGLIYFVTDGEAIKIGFARNVAKRVKGLQTSHHFPLFLIGSIPATDCEEPIIHKRFDHIRLNGEWFRITDELLQFITGFEERGEMIEGDQIENFKTKIKGYT